MLSAVCSGEPDMTTAELGLTQYGNDTIDRLLKAAKT